jgi:hypothetical protein
VLAESTRQRAKPFAAFVDEAPDFPVRHFKFQQRERGVGAGPCRQRSLDMCGFACPPQYRKPLAGAFQDLPKQGHCRGMGGLPVPIQWIQFCRLHGTKAHETTSKLSIIYLVRDLIKMPERSTSKDINLACRS